MSSWQNTSLATRFKRKYIPVTESGCWLWTGKTNQYGYGRFVVNGKESQAHRWSYEQKHGPIPDDLTIDHLCRVRCCVNPDHMEPVSLAVNVMRGIGIPAEHARQDKCIRGHLLSGDNLYQYGPRKRQCRLCRSEYQKHYGKVV